MAAHRAKASGPDGDPADEADTRYSRRHASARIIGLARALLPLTDGVTDDFVRGLCTELAISPAAFRTIFPTNEDLVRSVNQQLMKECVERLQSMPEAEQGQPIDLEAVATGLATAWPIDWAGVTIRAKEKAAALANPALAPVFLAAERDYAPAIVDVLVDLLRRAERQFAWRPILAVRVVLLTYERSFESWLMSGANERDFPSSPYIQQTLPRLLEEMTEPLAAAS